MKLTLKQNIILLIFVLLMIFFLTGSYTGAKYVYKEQYNFKVITPPVGYSYVFSPSENSESQSASVSLQSYLAGSNRINIYNLTDNTINSISISINYTSTVKNKPSTARFSIYNSAGALMATSSDFTFQKKTTADVSVSFSSLSLPNDGYVYVTMTGVTLNTPDLITLNTITVSIT